MRYLSSIVALTASIHTVVSSLLNSIFFNRYCFLFYVLFCFCFFFSSNEHTHMAEE